MLANSNVRKLLWAWLGLDYGFISSSKQFVSSSVFILKEDGFKLLKENGFGLLTEGIVHPISYPVAKEDGFLLLKEDNFNIMTEGV